MGIMISKSIVLNPPSDANGAAAQRAVGPATRSGLTGEVPVQRFFCGAGGGVEKPFASTGAAVGFGFVAFGFFASRLPRFWPFAI
jgi:hypothetical protein